LTGVWYWWCGSRSRIPLEGGTPSPSRATGARIDIVPEQPKSPCPRSSLALTGKRGFTGSTVTT